MATQASPSAASDATRRRSPGSSLSAGLAAALLRHVECAVFVVDAESRVIEWTESATRLLGRSCAEASGQWLGAILPFAARASADPEESSGVRAGERWRGEGTVTLPDGRELWVESSLSSVSVPVHGDATLVVSRDRTEQRAEARSREAMERARRILSRLNRELVRDTDEAELLAQACQILVEAGDYRLAWVGSAGEAGSSVKPLAAAVGDGERVIRPEPASIDVRPGHAVAVTSVRTGRLALGSALGGAPAGPDAPDVGIAALPLAHGGQLYGVVAVHGSEPEAFGDTGLETLTEFAADLGYGIAARRAHAANAAATSKAEADERALLHLRSGLLDVFTQIAADAPLEAIAGSICQQFATMPGVVAGAVGGFVEDSVEIIAKITPDAWPPLPSSSIPDGAAEYIRLRGLRGPWVERVDTLRALGWRDLAPEVKAVAFGPIVHGDHVDGALGVGTTDADFADRLVNRLPALAAFSAMASGLLAERLHERRERDDRRRHIESIIAARAFHPVFQVLVDLETRQAVGFEALTRFDAGERPDTCFADARRVGLGPALETATIAAAVDAAQTAVPPGLWLNVNISPRLLLDARDLRGILARAGHPVVVEVTEHEAVTDYGGVREAVRRLGPDVRLAVDDAGAGVANFGHIIELGSDFVKLDMSLVRRVNAHLGRQALVVGMQRFARSAGCRLIAEGVETELEAATLLELGVEFGQGYLFGMPQEHPSGSVRRRRMSRGRSTSPRLVGGND